MAEEQAEKPHSNGAPAEPAPEVAAAAAAAAEEAEPPAPEEQAAAE